MNPQYVRVIPFDQLSNDPKFEILKALLLKFGLKAELEVEIF